MPPPLYVNGLDANHRQILNLRIQNLAADPVAPFAGEVWFNTTSNLFKVWNGTGAVPIYPADVLASAATVVLRGAGGDVTGAVGHFDQITIGVAPAAATDAATKSYVDSVAQGLDPKPSAKAATVAALPTSTYANGTAGVGATLTATVAGALIVDGIAAAVGDVILAKNQAAAAQNGLYRVTQAGGVASPWILTRAVEMDTPGEIPGAWTYVEQGTIEKTLWVCTASGTPTIGTTPLPWSQFGGPGSFTATAPLTLTGTVISIGLAPRLVNLGGNLDLAAGVVTPGTFTSVTADTYGRVVAGGEIVTASGLLARTAANTYTARAVTGTADQIVVTNGDGVAGPPTIAIAPTYEGQTSIVTVGIVTAGTWQGTPVAVAHGGTGATTAPAARVNLGAIGLYSALIGNGAATSFTIPQATHGLAASALLDVTIWDATTGAKVYTNTFVFANGDVTIEFGTYVPSAGQFRVKIIG